METVSEAKAAFFIRQNISSSYATSYKPIRLTTSLMKGKTRQTIESAVISV